MDCCAEITHKQKCSDGSTWGLDGDFLSSSGELQNNIILVMTRFEAYYMPEDGPTVQYSSVFTVNSLLNLCADLDVNCSVL